VFPVVGDALIIVFDCEIGIFGHAAQLQRMFVMILNALGLEQVGNDVTLLAVVASSVLFNPQNSEAAIHPSTPPPDLITETPGPPPPGRIYVWIPGHWRWKHSQYAWVPGHYQRPPFPTARWIPGHWIQHRHSWFWIEGHWSD
jgi:hypothetical protein